MAEHTPGPWTAEIEGDRCLGIRPAYHNHPLTEDCYSSDDREDCPATKEIVTTDSGYYGPNSADARLIAAAPELLDALTECASYFYVETMQPSAYAALVEKVRAVIAKAEGR